MSKMEVGKYYKCVIIGDKSYCEGNYNTIIGTDNLIIGDYCIVIGTGNKVTGNNCLIVGSNLTIVGDNIKIPGDLIGNANEFRNLLMRYKFNEDV
jgi:hypothetical protein